MENNVVFNMAVCLIGFFILMVHVVNIVMKKGKRKDEEVLLVFVAFTAFHFLSYFLFSLIKTSYTSNTLIMGFYTWFYIANNLQALFFMLYMLFYVELPKKRWKTLQIGNIILFFVFVILDFVNLFTRFFFTSVDGVYTRAPMMILSQGYQFVCFLAVFITALANKKLNLMEKTSFALYCLLPLLAIILQNIFKGYAIAYLSIIVAIEILFFFLNVEKNLRLAMEEEKNKDAQIRVMLSQIQPHFIYNSLSAISTLITINPEKAQQGLDDFTEYLRLNLSSLTENRLIPFEDELRHIKTFIALEDMRFPGRIKVVYNLGIRDFYLPPLSIQPLVENAIKHGILQRIEGGTLTLNTYEKGEYYFVEVIDDGVGYDAERTDLSSNEHFGINNIAYRIDKMGKGHLNIESQIGKGTKAVAKFKK